MNVLITGASGFIGRAIIKKFKNTNHKILAISRKKKISKNNITWLKADISKIKQHYIELKKFDLDVLIFFSWDQIPNFSKKISNLNFLNSKKFIEFILKNTNCKKIIVSGSCFEYSRNTGICIENEKCVPSNHFTLAKLNLLKWIDSNCKKFNIKYAWFRIFYAYGPYQRKESIIPYLINKYKKNKIPLIKNPYASLDFIHVDDISKYVLASIDINFRSGIYNLGSGKSTKIINIYKIIKDNYPRNKSFYNELKKNPEMNYKKIDFIADLNKTKKTFRIKNKISLKQGIKKLINEI